ncbi:MAG: 2-dehydro-3-deoxy-6-phosphogalactonate aldolase, partial [Roseobacter sp.]
YGKEALIGAGTVLTVAEVNAVADAGGRLIVSPNCDGEVIAATKALEMQSWPGVFTPTETFAALKAGADGLKLFPGSMAGPSGLAALRAILPKGTRVYAVGGAGPENFRAWIKASADGFGLGSALYKPGMSAEDVGARARGIVSAYREALQ